MITPDSKPLWMRPKREKKVVLCDTCHGTGLVRLHNENPAYEGPYIMDCYACGGKGRVMKIISTEHFSLDEETLRKNTF